MLKMENITIYSCSVEMTFGVMVAKNVLVTRENMGCLQKPR